MFGVLPFSSTGAFKRCDFINSFSLEERINKGEKVLETLNHLKTYFNHPVKNGNTLRLAGKKGEVLLYSVFLLE